MKELPKGGLIGRAIHGFQALQALDIPLRAAYAGYFIVLSVFPALLLVLSSLRYTGLQVQDLVELLENVLPDALMGTATTLVYSAYRNASGAIAGVSALIALWSSSKGIYGLLTGLNAVYGVSENRGYLYTRFISIVYSLGFLLVLILTLVLHVFGGRMLTFLRGLDAPVLNFIIDILNLRFFLLMILQCFLFTAMFMVLPNGRNRFVTSLPGGLLSSIGWQVFTNLYSVYISNYSGYANVFGSVYAIALSMLWLYFCLCILLYGGALNRYLIEDAKKNL